jgi:hypothetical protein
MVLTGRLRRTERETEGPGTEGAVELEKAYRSGQRAGRRGEAEGWRHFNSLKPHCYTMRGGNGATATDTKSGSVLSATQSQTAQNEVERHKANSGGPGTGGACGES